MILNAFPARAQTGYTYYFTGSGGDAAGALNGGLLLAGGSTDVDDAMSWFKSRAGGGDVVVLRASGSDGYNDYLFSELPGTPVDSVETFVITQRSAASDSFVLGRVNNAEAIFFAGGDQSDYYNLWHDTPLEDAINQRAAAGAVVGGTSAGLAILGSSAYVALNRSLRSDRALANPYHRDVTLTHDFLTLSGLDHLITDSHFAQRDREGRLLTMMARSLDETDADSFRGLGLNEVTAVTVEPETGLATVRSNGGAGSAAFALQTTEAADVLQPNTPLTLRAVRATEFAAGDVFDFASFTAEPGVGEAFSFDVVNGVLSVGPAIEPPVSLPGDYSGSGLVEQEDLNLVLSNWGVAAASLPTSWINQRPAGGIVDQAELNTVLQNWGTTASQDFSAASTLPEPGALWVLVGLLCLATRTMGEVSRSH